MKLSLEQLKEVIATYVDEDKVSTATFNVTRDNTVALLDKIGKIVTLDTTFVDKLEIFDGEDLPYGKTIEEWQADLILPEDYDPSGAGALAPHNSTYRPNFYSQTLGRKKIPQTIKNDDLERAVNNPEELTRILAVKTKRLYDSVAAFRYGVKRQLLATFISLCDAVVDDAASYSASSSYTVGTSLKSGSPAEYGIVVKPITANAADTATWAKCKENGFVVLVSLTQEIDVPVDSTTGEDFIRQVKADVEKAQDISEGHSLNGNTLGAAEGLVLLLKQGIIPSIEVDVMAGAFHEQKVALPAEVKVIKDFGNDATGVFAILVDRRAVKLHNTYRAVRENYNGDGDFLNLFYHTEDTGYISRNAFIKIYREPAGE